MLAGGRQGWRGVRCLMLGASTEERRVKGGWDYVCTYLGKASDREGMGHDEGMHWRNMNRRGKVGERGFDSGAIVALLLGSRPNCGKGVASSWWSVLGTARCQGLHSGDGAAGLAPTI